MPTISFKVSADEARQLRRKARKSKITVSDYLRRAALDEPPPRRRKLLVRKHPLSGLPYDAGGNRDPVVSREEIAAALADFP